MIYRPATVTLMPMGGGSGAANTPQPYQNYRGPVGLSFARLLYYTYTLTYFRGGFVLSILQVYQQS